MNASTSDQNRTPGISVPLKSRREVEEEIARRVAEERQRLEMRAGLRTDVQHFQRPDRTAVHGGRA